MAYIDPGAGSIIVQTIMAAVIGGAAFFRRSLLSLLRLGRSKPPADAGK